jgi:hypothetical protein
MLMHSFVIVYSTMESWVYSCIMRCLSQSASPTEHCRSSS